MAANKCTSCFYAEMDKDLEPPCKLCTGYSNWVPRDMYKHSHDAQPLSEAIDEWFKGTNGTSSGDMHFDVVSKPKHYMLFEEEGIEVRDVIEKLVVKLDDANLVYRPMATADYTQMMQYLMRFMDKNGVEDLKKAKWYLDKLIQAYDDDESDV
jgi:hypothetical protein